MLLGSTTNWPSLHLFCLAHQLPQNETSGLLPQGWVHSGYPVGKGLGGAGRGASCDWRCLTLALAVREVPGLVGCSKSSTKERGDL